MKDEAVRGVKAISSFCPHSLHARAQGVGREMVRAWRRLHACLHGRHGIAYQRVAGGEWRGKADR